jgi:hypothetical protein
MLLRTMHMHAVTVARAVFDATLTLPPPPGAR